MAMESYFVNFLETSRAEEIVLPPDRASSSAMESYFVSLLEMSGAEEIVLLPDRASSSAMESYFVSLLEMLGAEEIVLLPDGASSSAMKSYFVSLLEMSGAEEIVLLRDDRASCSACLLGEEEKKKDMMFRRTVSLPSYGPPSPPLRKVSSENLHVVVRAGPNRSKKTSSSKKPGALKDFFEEVSPGLRPRPKKSWISQQDKEGRASPADLLLLKSNTNSLLRNVFSDVVQSHDDHSRARRSHERYATKVHALIEFLEEVEVVLGGCSRTSSSLNMGMSRKESRWT
jgi:hypothetical protein